MQHGAPGQVSRLRQKENLAQDDADKAIRNAIVPGCYIVPNGIFAVSRAQMEGARISRAERQPGGTTPIRSMSRR